MMHGQKNIKPRIMLSRTVSQSEKASFQLLMLNTPTFYHRNKTNAQLHG